jgi:hypothetical protein
LLVVEAAEGLAGVVDDPAFRNAAQAFCLLADAGAEFQVFKTVHVAGIKAVQCQEQGSSQQQGRRAQDLNRAFRPHQRVGGWEEFVEVRDIFLGAKDHSKMLHSVLIFVAVRVEQQGPHGSKPGLRGQGVAQRFEPTLLGHGVVVQEKEQLALGHMRGQIAGRSEANVCFLAQRQEPFPEELATQGRAGSGGGVVRGVVHHEHFEKVARRGSTQGMQALPGQRPLVADRDDDGQERGSVHEGRR